MSISIPSSYSVYTRCGMKYRISKILQLFLMFCVGGLEMAILEKEVETNVSSRNVTQLKTKGRLKSRVFLAYL